MNFTEYFFVHNEAKLVFFPINKNASTTYIQFFKGKDDWVHTDSWQSEYDSYHWFAHIQNPKERYIKGVSEVIFQNKLMPYLSQAPISQFILRIYYDKHVISIRDLFGESVECINFIPLEGDSNKRTYDFLMSFGLDYPDLIKYKPWNKSDRSKRTIQKKVNQIISSDSKAAVSYKNYTAPFYKKDDELWKQSRKKNNYPYTITYKELLDYHEMLKTEIELKQGMSWSDRFAYAFRFLFRG